MNSILDAQARFFAIWGEWRYHYPGLLLGADLLILLGIFGFFRKRMIRRSCLREEEYSARVLAPGLLRGRARSFMALIALLPLLLGWHRLAWDELPGGAALHWFVVVAALPLAWQFSTYGINYFYGRAHAVDRLLTAALGMAVAWHPGFAPPFVLMVLMLFQQFRYPIARHFRWTDKEALIEILMFFQAWLLARLLLAPVSVLAFVIAAFSVLGASYFYSGIRKIQLRWMRHEKLSYLFAAACQNGWLGFLTDEQRLRFAGHLDRGAFLLKWSTLILETGVIAALIHPWAAAAFLLGLFGLHIGIFASSGILFWMWMILDLAFIPLIFESWRGLHALGMLPWMPWLYSALLMLAAPKLWSVKRLGWIDTQLFGVYRFELVMEDGSVGMIAPAQLEPYDFPMAQGRLHFLHSTQPGNDTESPGDGPFDYTRMLNLQTDEAIEAARKAFRGAWGSRNRTAQFDRFIGNFFMHRGKMGGGLNRFARRLMAPHHIWTYPIGKPWTGAGIVRRARIHYIEYLFNDNEWKIIGDAVIHEIEIPMTNGPNAEL